MLKKNLFAFILLAALATSALAQESFANTMCPVMHGERIKKKFHKTWGGQEVYFCCRSCVKKFTKNPEKYTPNL